MESRADRFSATAMLRCGCGVTFLHTHVCDAGRSPTIITVTF
jgi:hypothetical protein